MRLKSKPIKNKDAENPTDENENDIHVDPKRISFEYYSLNLGCFLTASFSF